MVRCNTHEHIHVYVCVHTHTLSLSHTHTHTHMHTHTILSPCAHRHKHTLAHTHMRRHMCAQHTHVLSLSQSEFCTYVFSSTHPNSAQVQHSVQVYKALTKIYCNFQFICIYLPSQQTDQMIPQKCTKFPLSKTNLSALLKVDAILSRGFLC